MPLKEIPKKLLVGSPLSVREWRFGRKQGFYLQNESKQINKNAVFSFNFIPAVVREFTSVMGYPPVFQEFIRINVRETQKNINY